MRNPLKNEKTLLLHTCLLFLVMHVTGMLVSGLPYLLNAIITAVNVWGSFWLLQRLVYHRTFGEIIRLSGLRRTSLTGLYPGILLSIALLLAYPLLGMLPGVKLMMAPNAWPNLAGLFLTAGLTEEMLFRGYFLGRLRRQWSFRKASLVSMIIFSLAHLFMFTYMEWPVALLAVILAVCIAIPLAYLYEKGDQGIWSPAIVHTCIRSIGLVVTTGEKGFTLLSFSWIIACILLPNILLLFSKDFRMLWNNSRAAIHPGIYHL